MFANVTDWFAELDRFGAAFLAEGVVDRLRPRARDLPIMTYLLDMGKLAPAELEAH